MGIGLAYHDMGAPELQLHGCALPLAHCNSAQQALCSYTPGLAATRRRVPPSSGLSRAPPPSTFGVLSRCVPACRAELHKFFSTSAKRALCCPRCKLYTHAVAIESVCTESISYFVYTDIF